MCFAIIDMINTLLTRNFTLKHKHNYDHYIEYNKYKTELLNTTIFDFSFTIYKVYK